MNHRMKLSFLGTGGALSQGRFWTSFLVNDHILFDVAPTAPVTLKRLHKDICRISHIFISHFHGDHTMGLPFLLADYAFKNHRDSDLCIIGPCGIADYTKNMIEMAFPGLGDLILEKSKAQFHAVEGREREERAGDLDFRVYTMNHFDGPAYGYRVRTGSGTVSYSGDTGPCDSLKNLCEEAHAIVVEMNFVERCFPHHLNRQDILELKKSALPHQQILVTHIEEEPVPPIEGVIITGDLCEYEIPLSIE